MFDTYKGPDCIGKGISVTWCFMEYYQMIIDDYSAIGNSIQFSLGVYDKKKTVNNKDDDRINIAVYTDSKLVYTTNYRFETANMFEKLENMVGKRIVINDLNPFTKVKILITIHGHKTKFGPITYEF